jgi:hypothetical protein
VLGRGVAGESGQYGVAEVSEVSEAKVSVDSLLGGVQIRKCAMGNEPKAGSPGPVGRILAGPPGPEGRIPAVWPEVGKSRCTSAIGGLGGSGGLYPNGLGGGGGNCRFGGETSSTCCGGGAETSSTCCGGETSPAGGSGIRCFGCMLASQVGGTGMSFRRGAGLDFGFGLLDLGNPGGQLWAGQLRGLRNPGGGGGLGGINKWRGGGQLGCLGGTPRSGPFSGGCCVCCDGGQLGCLGLTPPSRGFGGFGGGQLGCPGLSPPSRGVGGTFADFPRESPVSIARWAGDQILGKLRRRASMQLIIQ